MDDLSQKINEIISDPEALEQIKALGGMLGIGAGGSAPQPAAQSTAPAPQPQPQPQPQQVMSPLGGISPDMVGMMMKLAPLLSSMNEENDSTRLLTALRPFLSEKRRGRIDGSIRLLGLIRMLPLLKGAFG